MTEKMEQLRNGLKSIVSVAKHAGVTMDEAAAAFVKLTEMTRIDAAAARKSIGRVCRKLAEQQPKRG